MRTHFNKLLCSVTLLLLACGTILAQTPPPRARETAEPPLANDSTPNPLPPIILKSRAEPEAVDPEIQPAQHTAPVRQNPTAPVSPAAVPTVVPQRIIYPEPAIPTIKVAVISPAEHAMPGEELKYKLVVQNISEAKVLSLMLVCRVKGAKVEKTIPASDPKEGVDPKDELHWMIGAFDKGDRREYEVIVTPQENAEDVQVSGLVQFRYGRYVKTHISVPKLELMHTGPAEGVRDEPLTYHVAVKNNGLVAVKEVVLTTMLPKELIYSTDKPIGVAQVVRGEQPDGAKNWSIGTMQPGETKNITYKAVPKEPGEFTAQATVRAQGIAGSRAEVVKTRVGTAGLMLQMVEEPPGKTGTIRQRAEYKLILHNTGTVPLSNVRFACAFPKDLQVVRASKDAQFFADSAQWVVKTLAPGDNKIFHVALTATTTGRRKLVFSAKGDYGLDQKVETAIDFEGVSALNWSIESPGTGKVGDDLMYTISVTNPGSAAVREVKILGDLPTGDQVKFISAVPTHGLDGHQLLFNPFTLEAKKSQKLEVQLKALKGGSADIRFQMSASGFEKVTKSAATQIQSTAKPVSPEGAPKTPLSAPPKENSGNITQGGTGGATATPVSGSKPPPDDPLKK